MAYIKLKIKKIDTKIVGEKGLEPLTREGPVPKTGAYTNSATRPNSD